MDVRANEADLSDIFAHQEWVRALALRLCGDHAAADDLVQDTWVAAMRDRDNVRSVRAWLGGIVRHRWRRDQLRSNARADREASVARDVATRSHEMPSPEGMLAQAELQRRVLAAVASLEEAARTVVLLRYYEGLSSEAIAARLGEPSSTVRNRLARAHEKLRGLLDHDYGGDRGAWSVAFAPAFASHAGSLSTGIGVAMKAKLLVAATLVVAGSAWLWSTLKPDARAAGAPVMTSEPPSKDREAPLQTPVVAATTPGSTRESVADSASTSTEPLLVWGQLHGPTTEQAAKAEIWLRNADGVRKTLAPGANATYSAFGLHPGTMSLFVALHGFVTQEDELVLAGGDGTVRHDVTLTPAFLLPVKFVDRSSGEALKPTNHAFGTGLAAVATRTRPERIENMMSRIPWFADAGSYRANEGFGSDSDVPPGYDGVVEVRPPLPVYVSCVLRDTVIDSRLVHGNEKDLVFELDAAEWNALFGRVDLRCVDVAGAGIANAALALDYRDATGGASGKTGDDGAATMEHVAPGMQTLSIRAKGFANYRSVVRVLPHATTDLGTIELRPATAVRGRVVDQAGNPLDGRVTIIPMRQCASPQLFSGNAAHPCQPGGKFDINNVERGQCRLLAQAKGFAYTAMSVDTSGGDVADLEIRLRPGTQVRVQVPKTCTTFVPFVIADATGSPIVCHDASATYAPELVLEPGHYQCWTLVDERIARRQEFDVGSATVIVQVDQP